MGRAKEASPTRVAVVIGRCRWGRRGIVEEMRAQGCGGGLRNVEVQLWE